MKRNSLLIVFLWVSFALTGQSTAHYKVLKVENGSTNVSLVLELLEANLPLYQQWLPSTNPLPTLNVNFYQNNASFNNALAPQRLMNHRTDFIYLYYNNPEKDVLYLYPLQATVNGATVDSTHNLSQKMMNESLNRHGFLQYLFAVAPTSPSWFREGSALYFESIREEDGEARKVAPNRNYLANLKNWQNRDTMTIEELLSLTDETFTNNTEKHLVYSWGLVHFLTATNRMALLKQLSGVIQRDVDQKTNTDAVKALVMAANLQAEFDQYISDTRTFTELVTLGSQAYVDGNTDQAKEYFNESIKSRGDLYSGYYYLGLIAYDQGRYDEAKNYYQKALYNNAPDALINYGLGFVAFKEKAYDLSEQLLQRAKIGDYGRYGVGADRLLSMIPVQRQVDAQAPSSSSPNAKVAPVVDTTPAGQAPSGSTTTDTNIAVQEAEKQPNIEPATVVANPNP